MPAALTRVSLALPDTQIAELEEKSHQRHLSFDTMAQHVIRAGLQVVDAPAGKTIMLAGDSLEAVEKILGGMPILHVADLLEKLSFLAGISFEHVRLPFTPSQLEALAEKADRQGLSVEELVRRTAPRIQEMFFDLTPRM